MVVDMNKSNPVLIENVQLVDSGTFFLRICQLVTLNFLIKGVGAINGVVSKIRYGVDAEK